MNRIRTGVAAGAIAVAGLGLSACGSGSSGYTGTQPTQPVAPASQAPPSTSPVAAGGYWIATGTDPGFGPYLDLLQWGPSSSSGAITGTLATYGMSVSGDGPGPDGGAGQVISTTTTVTITGGNSNLAISAEIGNDPVTDTATVTGSTLTMYDPEHQLIGTSPTVFEPGTPSAFSADLAQIVAEAPNGLANY